MMQGTSTSSASRHPGDTVLVTGASGFIGTRLVSRLRAQGTKVVATDILPPRERLNDVEYLTWDVREPAPSHLGTGLSRIYNLAAVHRTPGHPAHEYYEINVLGATNVISFAETRGVDTVVFTSSISVYGPSEQLMDEAYGPQPVSAYGRSKRIAEVIHEAWQERGMARRLIIVRPGVVFGPGERGNYTHLAHTLSRGIFFYPGRKSTIKSGGYVDELLSTLEFALDQPDEKVLFNFAYPTQSTIEDIVNTFTDVCSFRGHYATLPVAPLYIIASLFEAANHLGISNPIHRERIAKLVRSTRIDPSWLKTRGYLFQTDLKRAVTAWYNESNGTFT